MGKQTQTLTATGKRALLLIRRKRDLRRAKRTRCDETYTYIVVLTYGRTGSTVLQAALNSVDGVCIRGENYAAANHLWSLYKSTRRARTSHGSGNASDPGNPWYGSHLIDHEGLLDDLRKAFIEHVLRPPTGTRVLGFKEIRHTTEYFDTADDLLEYVMFLDGLLPGVRFVVNTRNVEDTSSSGWWRTHPDAGDVLARSRTWLLDLPARIETRLGPGRVVAVEYDEWNARPESLQALLAKLGLTGDINLLRRISGERLTHMRNFPRAGHAGDELVEPSTEPSHIPGADLL